MNVSKAGNKITIWSLAAFALGLAGVIAWTSRDGGTAETSELKEVSQNTSTPTDQSKPELVWSANLSAVDGSSASGSATLRSSSTTYVHEVVASLEPSAQGEFYEGWLVGDSGFISTGRLNSEEQAGGVNSVSDFSLTYSSDESIASYDKVVITAETESLGEDGVPERHVLEGAVDLE